MKYVRLPYKKYFPLLLIKFCKSIDFNIYAFTNNTTNTDNKSSHIVGFKAGLAQAVKDYQEESSNKTIKNPISAEDTREGIVTIINVKVPNPNYVGQGKQELQMPTVRKAVSETIQELLTDFCDKNPNEAKLILEKSLEAQRVRETVRKAKETARKTKGMGNGPKPEKLVKCVSKVPEDSVLFIVEGR